MTKKGDRLVPSNPEYHLRNRRWRHNALTGHLRRAKLFTLQVMNSDSCNAEAKAIAVRIEQDLDILADQLKHRIDPT